MSQNLADALKVLRTTRDELKKAAFLPLPPDMPQQPQMDPNQAAMMQQGGGGMPMDPAMAQGGAMPQGGQPPMDPAMMQQMAMGAAAPGQGGGATPDMSQAIEEILGALQEMMQVSQEQAQMIQQQDQRIAALEQQLGPIMQALQSPAPMDGGVQQ